MAVVVALCIEATMVVVVTTGASVTVGVLVAGGGCHRLVTRFQIHDCCSSENSGGAFLSSRDEK